jgi:Spy/CpxP family protein refolding chaperone
VAVVAAAAVAVAAAVVAAAAAVVVVAVVEDAGDNASDHIGENTMKTKSNTMTFSKMIALTAAILISGVLASASIAAP